MNELNDDYSATLADGVKMLKRILRIAKPLGYVVSLYGSTLLNGKGHDIDLNVVGAVAQAISPNEMGVRIIKQHAKSVLLCKYVETGNMADVYLVIVTHDNFCVDLHIKGAL